MALRSSAASAGVAAPWPVRIGAPSVHLDTSVHLDSRRPGCVCSGADASCARPSAQVSWEVELSDGSSSHVWWGATLRPSQAVKAEAALKAEAAVTATGAAAASELVFSLLYEPQHGFDAEEREVPPDLAAACLRASATRASTPRPAPRRTPRLNRSHPNVTRTVNAKT